MKVCLILEGSYPYARGGVSTWAHEYIKSRPETQFVLWTISANHDAAEKRLYEVPKNVTEIKEIFLEAAYNDCRCKKRCSRLVPEIVDALSQFTTVENNNWQEALRKCHEIPCSINEIARSEAFLDYVIKVASGTCNQIGLSDAFYGLRSMLLPVLYILQQPIPDADIYHSAVAGYGGLLGALAHIETSKPFILTEHGIYPREREEELIQAEWVSDSMRDIWIRLFYNMSRCAYAYASKVTSLFKKAMARQCEIGCDTNKCIIVPNGISFERFSSVQAREVDGTINIGAFIRFAPIKDVKTLIRAFYTLSKRVQNVTLYIMGGTDDPDYKEECIELISRMNIKNIRIEGHIDTLEYLSKMDFTVMTSISEGQPLAILESLAAGRPCVTTNVGNCMELLMMPEDNLGQAGLCCAPMDVYGLATAMEKMCLNPELRAELGKNGRARIEKYYTHDKMTDRYFRIYDEVL